MNDSLAAPLHLMPVVVMSFNRPELLRRVLQSLKQQTLPVSLSKVHLFQDGARSRFASEGDSFDDELQRACLDVFQKEIPEGVVHYSEQNLGIALNFERAEQYVFESLKSPLAVFLEDDLILGPRYMEALAQLADFALREERVAYAAVYGNHQASLAEQRELASKIVPMGHKWGFVLTRRQWLRQKAFIDGYLDIVRAREYGKRDSSAIAAYFASHGYTSPGTSQDAAKDVASHVLGTTKIMSLACFGQYVGEAGVHFRPAEYQRQGFGKTEIFEGQVPKFALPSAALLDSWIDVERQRARLATATMRHRPTLKPSMTADEQACYRSVLVGKSSLVEFGAGGSTAFAATCGIREILSIESDASWVEKLMASEDLRAFGDSVRFDLRHINIGPTADWGVPKDTSAIRNWPKYWQGPWPRSNVDVVLVDGRFRVACALYSALNTPAGTTFVIHDFWNRPHYHDLLSFLQPICRADTMGVFVHRADFDAKQASAACLRFAFNHQ